jgi:hypothetical protein
MTEAGADHEALAGGGEPVRFGDQAVPDIMIRDAGDLSTSRYWNRHLLLAGGWRAQMPRARESSSRCHLLPRVVAQHVQHQHAGSTSMLAPTRRMESIQFLSSQKVCMWQKMPGPGQSGQPVDSHHWHGVTPAVRSVTPAQAAVVKT